MAGPLVEALQQVRRPGDEAGESALLEPAERRRRQRLGGDGEALREREAEEIADEGEAHHLPPPIRQEPRQAQGSLGDVVDGAGPVVLLEQGLARVEMDVLAQRLQSGEFLARERRTDADEADLARGASALRSIRLRMSSITSPSRSLADVRRATRWPCHG